MVNFVGKQTKKLSRSAYEVHKKVWGHYKLHQLVAKSSSGKI